MENKIQMFIEEKGDIFDLDCSYALAHCVGKDFSMGKGIAIEFEKKFGMKDWLIKQNKPIGCALLLRTKDHNIFYLITKEFSKRSKPTYKSIENTIIDMFEQALKYEIYKIAMPKIGCGLDRKNWEKVKSIILKHKPPQIEIIVKYLD
jgi:O-acetyl-ADP-ribose deacetylase (regulator of RNase III)